MPILISALQNTLDKFQEKENMLSSQYMNQGFITTKYALAHKSHLLTDCVHTLISSEY